jgi:hypothetical protein
VVRSSAASDVYKRQPQGGEAGAAMEERAWGGNGAKVTPLEHHGQENEPESWPIANMIIGDFEGVVETAATFKNPRYCNWQGRPHPYGHLIANSLWSHHGLPKPTRNQIPKSVCATKDWETSFPVFDQLKWQ